MLRICLRAGDLFHVCVDVGNVVKVATSKRGEIERDEVTRGFSLLTTFALGRTAFLSTCLRTADMLFSLLLRFGRLTLGLRLRLRLSRLALRFRLSLGLGLRFRLGLRLGFRLGLRLWV